MSGKTGQVVDFNEGSKGLVFQRGGGGLWKSGTVRGLPQVMSGGGRGGTARCGAALCRAVKRGFGGGRIIETT